MDNDKSLLKIAVGLVALPFVLVLCVIITVSLPFIFLYYLGDEILDNYRDYKRKKKRCAQY